MPLGRQPRAAVLPVQVCGSATAIIAVVVVNIVRALCVIGLMLFQHVAVAYVRLFLHLILLFVRVLDGALVIVSASRTVLLLPLTRRAADHVDDTPPKLPS